jgi:hypothetical protein
MMGRLNDAIDLICLVYHEARNLSSVATSEPKYARLASLPRERHDAWRAMAELRTEAFQAGLVKSAVWTFEDHFEVEIAELVPLFKEEGLWRPRCGGPSGSAICSRVPDLTKATEPAQAESLVREILSMQHNSASVGEKLLKLRNSGAMMGQTRRV